MWKAAKGLPNRLVVYVGCLLGMGISDHARLAIAPGAMA